MEKTNLIEEVLRRSALASTNTPSTVPGDYVIQAELSHSGPRDESVVEWKSSKKIKVTGSGSKPSLKILSPKKGETFRYQEEIKVAWSLSTDRMVDLLIELMDDKNCLCYDKLESISYNEPQEQRSFTPISADYDKALLAGKRNFKLRLRAMDRNGKEVLSKESEEITLLPELVHTEAEDGLKLLQDPKNSLKVKLSYRFHYPETASYVLDWGDGARSSKMSKLKESAEFDPKVSYFVHQYAKPGKYKAVLKSNDPDPLKSLSEIAAVDTLWIDLKKKKMNGFTP